MPRFSKKQLDQMSDLEFAAIIMDTHAKASKNPRSPMTRKYRLAAYRLKCLAQKEKSTKKNWWDIIYTDAHGMKTSCINVPEHERRRIGEMVAQGYACGEILTEEEC